MSWAPKPTTAQPWNQSGAAATAAAAELEAVDEEWKEEEDEVEPLSEEEEEDGSWNRVERDDGALESTVPDRVLATEQLDDDNDNDYTKAAAADAAVVDLGQPDTAAVDATLNKDRRGVNSDASYNDRNNNNNNNNNNSDMEEPVEPPLPVASPDAALVTAERRNTNTNTNNSLLSLGSAVPSPMPVSSPSSSRLAYDFYVRSPQSDILNASHNNNDNDSIHNSNNSGGGGTTTTTSLNLQLPPDLMNDDFAQVIRERTRQRRLQDDASVANLRVQVSRLEAALGVACRRRVDAVTAIQSQAAAAVQALEERLSTQVAADVSRVADRLTRLEQRMTGLETQWRDNVGSIQDSVQHSTVKLQSQLQSLQQAVAQERTGATQRLDRLSQQMQTTAQDYDDRWQHERQERIAAVATLHDTMQAVHSVRELNVSQVERELTNELRSLQTALAQERHERQTYDDELRSVVNRYSKNIQESLAATTLLSSSSSELRTLASPHGGGSGGRIHDNPYYHRGA